MKKNIVFRSGSLRMGGLERVLVEVLQTIDKNKYDVSLMITDDSGEENIFLKDIPEGIKIYFLKPEVLMRKTEKYRNNRKKSIFSRIMYNVLMFKERGIIVENSKKALKKIEKELGPIEVFIDFDWGAIKYIEKLKMKRSIVWIHNSIPSLLGNRKNKIERFGKKLSKYSKIIAICDDMKEEIMKLYPYLRGRVDRLYNPFNFERIEKLSEDKSSLKKEEWKLIKDKYFVAVSRLDNVQKDYPTLLKAMKKLKERGFDENLYIIGDGPDRAEIENEIKELGIEDTVKLIGLTENPYVWMKNAEFFVHSSKYEGLPTVLIEAMICDKIVISSNCPTGPKEILRNGQCGMLYPVGDSEALAQYMENILKNPEIKNKYYQEMIERREEFRKESVILEYERIIDGRLTTTPNR